MIYWIQLEEVVILRLGRTVDRLTQMDFSVPTRQDQVFFQGTHCKAVIFARG